MKELKEIIKKLQETKYQNSLIEFSQIEKKYIIQRDMFYNSIKHKKFSKVLEKDNLFFKLREYNRERKINTILKYYKKFNIFLNLRSRYKYHKPISKKSANLNTILYLCKLIIDMKKLNFYQNLNYLLKVNDYFILNFDKRHVDNETINLALSLYLREKKMISILANE